MENKSTHPSMNSINDSALSRKSWKMFQIMAEFVEGLLNWFASTMVNEGTINKKELDLIKIIDKPRQIVNAFFEHYEHSGFEPSAEEAEILLQL